MKNTQPTVTFGYNSALELVTAAASVSATHARVTANATFLPPVNDEVRAWRARVDAELSPFDRSDLDLVFSTVTVLVALAYATFREETRTPETLIAFLRSVDDDEFVEGFRHALFVDEAPDEWLKERMILEALERDRDRETIPFAEEARQLIQLLSAPAHFRKKTADVLDWFYHRFLAADADRIAARMEARIDAWREQVLDNVPDALKRLSGGNYETLLAKCPEVTILPVFYSSRERSMFIPGNANIVIGIDRAAADLAPDNSDEATRSATDELLKALSDPTRLAILRLVRERPRYNRELATELGISPPTASYHVDKLLQTNLLRLELSQGRRFYYAVNPEGIERLRESLKVEFLP